MRSFVIQHFTARQEVLLWSKIKICCNEHLWDQATDMGWKLGKEIVISGQKKCQLTLYSNEAIGKSIICNNLAENVPNDLLDMSNETFRGKKTLLCEYNKQLEEQIKEEGWKGKREEGRKERKEKGVKNRKDKKNRRKEKGKYYNRRRDTCKL